MSYALPAETRTTVDHRGIASALRLLAEVERYRPGLGVPVLFVTAARLGTLTGGGTGRGLYLIAEMSGGKGATLYGSALPSRFGLTVEAGTELSPAWLSRHIAAKKKGGDPVDRVAVIFEDCAGLAGRRDRTAQVMNAGGWGVSNRRFTDKGFHSRSEEAEAHRFESFFFACGMTPRVFGQISSLGGYPDMWADRYSRFALVRSAQIEARISRYEKTGTVEDSKVSETVAGYLDDVPETVRFDLSEDDVEETFGLLYKRQHGRRRGLHYLRSDARGVAAINGRAEVIPEDLEVLKLALPYLFLGSLPPLTQALVMAGALGLPPGKGRGPVRLADVAESLSRSPRTLLDPLSQAAGFRLLRSNLDHGRRDGDLWVGFDLWVWLQNIENARRAGLRLLP